MKELSLVIVFRKARYSAWRPTLVRCKQIRACANFPFALVICFEVMPSQISSLILPHPRRRIVTFALPDGRLSLCALPDGRVAVFALPVAVFALPAVFGLPDGRVSRALFVRCTIVGAELALTPPMAHAANCGMGHHCQAMTSRDGLRSPP